MVKNVEQRTGSSEASPNISSCYSKFYKVNFIFKILRDVFIKRYFLKRLQKVNSTIERRRVFLQQWENSKGLFFFFFYNLPQNKIST